MPSVREKYYISTLKQLNFIFDSSNEKFMCHVDFFGVTNPGISAAVDQWLWFH